MNYWVITFFSNLSLMGRSLFTWAFVLLRHLKNYLALFVVQTCGIIKVQSEHLILRMVILGCSVTNYISGRRHDMSRWLNHRVRWYCITIGIYYLISLLFATAASWRRMRIHVLMGCIWNWRLRLSNFDIIFLRAEVFIL